MVYPILEQLIFMRGIKQKTIAEALNISVKSLGNKRKGQVPFTWPEVCMIQVKFFPDITKEKLFSKDDPHTPASGE